MANTNLLNIGVLLIWAAMSSTEADRCLKSFPSGTAVPNDELMMALYLADPNPETGVLFLHGYKDEKRCVTRFVGNTLSYESWLALEHDAHKEMTNLWSFLNRVVVSSVYEFWCHNANVLKYKNNRPKGIVDFGDINVEFYHGCKNWNTVKDKWPYSCFDSAFYCKMYDGMVKIRSMVMGYEVEEKNGQYISTAVLKSLNSINQYPWIGMENSPRTNIVDIFFHPDVLKFIPDSAQDNFFYHSRLIWETLKNLMKGKTAIESTMRYEYNGAFDKIKSRCTEKPDEPVSVKYYCRAKAYIEKIRACLTLSDVTPCIYDNAVQEYFVRGRFGHYDELQLINAIIEKTKTILNEVKEKVAENDRNGLNSLYNKYNPYITVGDSMCQADWPKAFNCTNNIRCNCTNNIITSQCNPALTYYDCNGGYTCRIDTMYRFDCLLKFVLKQIKQLVDASAGDNWGIPGVVKAKNDLILWLSYLPMARYTSFAASEINSVILDIQGKVNKYVTSYDTDGLKSFISNLPKMSFVPQWAKDTACQQVSVPSMYSIFCNLDPLINSAILFIKSFENSKNSTTKTLKPTVDYRTLLDQLQLQRAAHLINVQTQEISNQFQNVVQRNTEELSSYFSSLANYDKTKADADIGYIDGRLKVFNEKISSVSNSVTSKFQLIFKLAIGINAAEIVGQLHRFAVAMAQVCNPLSTALGGSSVMDYIDTINSLAQAGVTTAIIARIGDKEFPDLKKRAIDLGTKFADNEAQLKDARTFIDKVKKGEDAVGTANDFLGKYNSYTPKVLLPEITSYGAKWETVSDQLCEAAFSAETAPAALIEIGLASTGDCVNIKVEIQELIAYYEELYDYQFDFMDSLSDAARSYLAYKKAADLTSAYTNKQALNTVFLKHTAVNAFMVSTLNVWEIVTEYCDALTYTRGGEVPDKCESALRTPSHRSVAEVMGYKPNPLCHTNNEITHFLDIPINSTGANDKAYIDLKALYARETVTFKIPSFQWLKDNGWFGNYDSEKAMYIKRFEIFLPPMSGNEEHLIEVEVQPSMANYLRYGGIKYLLPVTGYTARYTENGKNCYNTKMNNPYAICRADDLSKLCILSNGYVDRAIQPSIFNEWKIKVNSLPANTTPPRPATNFKIQAGITMCMVSLSPSAKKREIPMLRRVLKSRAVNRTRRNQQHCCASNQYWTGSQCSNCPSGTSQLLHGYYCQ